MDHNYGVIIQNKFSLFYDEDDDPMEQLAKAEEAAKAKKKDDGDKKSSKSKVKKAAAPEVKKAPEQSAFKKDGSYCKHYFVSKHIVQSFPSCTYNIAWSLTNYGQHPAPLLQRDKLRNAARGHMF